MPFIMRNLYKITIGRKYKLPKSKSNNKYLLWKEFFKAGYSYDSTGYVNDFGKNDPAVMLHSGGSTGTPKAIVLSNGNFLALSKESITVFADIEKGDKCLSIMPVFHGFGLGVCIYTPFCLGAECIFIPTFKAQEFDKILTKHKPEFVIGVPTLFEALLKIPEKRKKKLDFSNLKYAISGGDALKAQLVKDVNKLFKEKGSKVGLIQGYGMSESLAAVALEKKWIPKKDGTVGIPFPGCYIGIYDHNDKEVPYGKEGEICVSGPNVMLGYYNNEKETNLALHIHKDGNVWLHSGDIGVMDKDGYITYKSRLKRLIISSGYNVYPSQIEELLESHPAVMLASAIGVPHPYKQEVVKVFIVLIEL
jgi:long-chain acyl-CoA synthetase